MKEKAWDEAICSFRTKAILSNSLPSDRARLLASCAPGVGSCLHILPAASLVLRLSDSEIRIAVGLRLGCPIVSSHTCVCVAKVQPNGHHSLACKRIKRRGRHTPHHMIIDLITRSLRSAGVPFTLEPPGLFRSDGKRPDGATLIPWFCGRSLRCNEVLVERACRPAPVDTLAS